MTKNFTYYLSLFLNNYLIIETNSSPNTVKSYKYTFKLLVNYLMEVENFKINNILFEKISRDKIINFLNYLENEKHCSISTRNQRLAAIKSFYSFVKCESSENIYNFQNILSIRQKKATSKAISYLTIDEMKFFLAKINQLNPKERRNLVLLSLLYDSAARVAELVNIKVCDLRLDNNPIVSLLGKGNKVRTVPIMESTSELLTHYIKQYKLVSTSYLFQNSKSEKCSTKMVEHIINKYSDCLNKKISPHSFRHSRAMHLLEAGVNLIYIRDFLGHSSITTTEIYAKANDEIKRQAIINAYPESLNNNVASWNEDKDLLKELLDL